MKTSVIEVRDMLSVLSVLGVEELIGKVPGVASVTMNYATGHATVRYDETRLEIADIKAAARQIGYEAADAVPSPPPKPSPTATPKPSPAPSAAAPAPKPALAESPDDAAAPATANHAGHEQHDKPAPGKS